MKKHFIIGLMLILLIGGATVIAQDEDNAITWTMISDEPLSPYGEIRTWNSNFNEPGAVIYHDEQYHLFVNGYQGLPANNGIGYRVSDDGVNYEWATEDPLLRRDDMPNDPLAIAATDVLVQEDGTWVLYYYNFNASGWPRIRGTMGRATASHPAGPWTPDADPILVGGEEDSWDERSVAYASVIAHEGAYVMYYIGENSRGIESLGRAISDDGIVWEKDPEPVFELDPDLGEGTNFVVNQVIYDGERWILAYKFNRIAVGIAISDDGITWERYGGNPIMSPSAIEGINQIGYISFMMDDDGQYMLFIEGNDGSGRTQVYGAIVDIP